MEPNLFRIDRSIPGNPFSQTLLAMEGISYEDGIPNLVISEAGCFKGDCYCCPEDGSGNPIAEIYWENGKFTYYTQRSELSNLYYAVSISLFGGFIRQELGDISGEIPTYTSGSLQGSGIPESLIFYGYAIQASNSCGSTVDFAYCYGVFCYGYFTIDCVSSKIKSYVNFSFVDGQNANPEIVESSYNLGSVPDIYIEKNNGCGPGCYVDLKPECLFTKNSLVYEFTGFSDIFWEAEENLGNGWISYQSWSYTGLSAFNLSYILPLYIAPCNISSGSIRYNLPGIISRGTGVRTYNSILYYNGNIYSSISTVWNLEYFTNGVIPNFKVIEYNSGSGWVSCPQLGDNSCRGGQVYGWKSKYDDESDAAFDDPASYTKPVVCGKTLISRYLLLDQNIIRGTSLAYYANL